MKGFSPSSENDRKGRAARAEAELPALDWMRRAHAEEELLVEVGKRIRHHRRRRLAMTSMALAAAMTAGLSWNILSRESNPSPSFNATITLPERRVLPDRSIVELKAGAQIDVDYEGAFRRVVLLRGEAHFQVMKNSRPFVVEAAGVQVRAVGTGFSVQLALKQVEVLVTEGQVRVASDPALSPSATQSGEKNGVSAENRAGSVTTQPIVAAGYRAVVPFNPGGEDGGNLRDPRPQISAVSEAELDDRLSWRIPNLEFSRTRLTEVVALMNQHAAGRQRVLFEVASPELREVRLSGFLRTDNSEGLVRLLESNFGIKAERSGDTITLRKAR